MSEGEIYDSKADEIFSLSAKVWAVIFVIALPLFFFNATSNSNFLHVGLNLIATTSPLFIAIKSHQISSGAIWYVLKEDHIIIKGAIRTQKIKYSSIVSLKEEYNEKYRGYIFTTAPSPDRIYIECKNPSYHAPILISVSPLDKEGFLTRLTSKISLG